QSGDFFIFTGITLAVNKTIREQIVSVLTELKARGTKIVFDINFRSNLWTKAEALPVIQSVLPLVDVLFFGKKDATHLL
ncbi:sugar kinase, partial [Staphylococcus aureus]|nr:sugar kinase [Staphylococcus aureus]